jgi:recombination protein RecR
MIQQFPSKYVEEAVNEISKLPGIGRKTALRMALWLLKEPADTAEDLAASIVALRQKTTFCQKCHNIADSDVCSICTSRKSASTICVVETTREVLAIENTAQYHGLYHVLGGLIAPMQGIGPGQLETESLLKRIQENQDVVEVIFALSPTMDGDMTAHYLEKKIKEIRPVTISRIARGVPVGADLEYADEVTLGRSILSRVVS